MADEAIALRGFELTLITDLWGYQHVAFEFDLAGTIKAVAILQIRPLKPSLCTVRLDASPQLDIRSISLSSAYGEQHLASTPATWTLLDPLQPLPTREPPLNVQSHTEIKRRTCAAVGEAEQGGLAVSVMGGWIRLDSNGDKLETFDIRIEYEIHTDKLHGVLGPEWVPCVDSLWMRCFWEMRYIVPKQWDNVPVVVASSGTLRAQTAHPHSSSKAVFAYYHKSKTSIQHVGFALGPYTVSSLSDRVVAFGAEETPLAFVPDMLSFYIDEFGRYPNDDFQIVFVSGLSEPITLGSLLLVPDDMTHTSADIEPAVSIRQVIATALAQQWCGIQIIPQSLSDTWLVNGIALYLQSLCLRHFLGNNEYRSRLKRDIDRCVRIDQGEQGPVCQPGAKTIDIAFINLKAPLVLHILDRHLINGGTSLGLVRVLKSDRILLAAQGETLGIDNTLSTAHFLRSCRRVTGVDCLGFADQWIFGSGCPHFRVTTHFSRKKFVVEFTITQQTPIPFTGSLTVRIHEADGAPFEHIVDIKQKNKTFTLPFNTKYKRTRRLGRMAARLRMDADEETPEIADAFQYPPWEDATVREEWRVADWTDEQAQTMMGEGGGYEWIRLDPECEWLAWFDFPERPWYWISQVQGDRDVVAQLQAVQFLSTHQIPVVASELAKVVLIRNYFYRVRIAAVRALVAFDTPDCNHIGSFLLHKLLDQTVSDPADYFVHKAIIGALGHVQNGKSRLLDAIGDGGPYTAAIVSALGSHMDNDVADAIDKALTIDRLAPSYGNTVSKAGLLAHLKSAYAGKSRGNLKLFLAYTREGNLDALRRLAVDCLLLCQPLGRNTTVLRYLLQLIQHDESPSFRQYTANALCESVLVSLSCGEVLSEDLSDADTLSTLRRVFSEKLPALAELDKMLIRKHLEVDESVRWTLLRLAETVTFPVAEPGPGTILKLAPLEAPAKIRLSVPETPAIKLTISKPRGLSTMDATFIRYVLQKLLSSKLSAPFQRPVDPVRDGAPNYYKIIDKPIDLASIGAKIDARVYTSRADFANDFRLMMDNCFKYNPPTSQTYQQGRKLSALFDKYWANSESTLNTTLRSDPPAPVTLRAPAVAPISGLAPAPAPAPAAAPTIKIKPMAPPPLPLKIEVKKRKSVVDDLLSAEVDAMDKSPKVPSPPVVRQPVVRVPAPVAAPAPVIPARQPPPRLPETTGNTMSFKSRRAKTLLTILAKDPNSVLFLAPVDPIRDGCPTYLEEIKHPMDFGTMQLKIDRKKYKTMGDFARDVELVFFNCRKFNPPGDITALADRVEDLYWREWPKAVSPIMSPEEKKNMIALLNKSLKDPVSEFFREAVDPVKLGIPTYFEVIPQEDARDLSLILRKLKSGEYQMASQVDQDVNLMVENAIMFNVEGVVVDCANNFREWWRKRREE